MWKVIVAGVMLIGSAACFMVAKDHNRSANAALVEEILVTMRAHSASGKAQADLKQLAGTLSAEQTSHEEAARNWRVGCYALAGAGVLLLGVAALRRKRTAPALAVAAHG